jgi:gliding motility-associated-like protein
VEKVGCESYVDFPTGFSPNGDGVNDVFRARYSYDVRKFALRIYNRWGELVFETADVNEGWNGIYKAVAQPMSVYVWVAEYSFLDGSRNAQSGNVSLIR